MLLEGHVRGRQLLEGKVDVGIAAIDEPAFRRPEGSDLVVVEPRKTRLHRRIVEPKHAIADQGEGRARRPEPSRLGLEGRAVEPVSGLGRGDQIGAAVWKRQVFGGRAEVGDPPVRGSIRDLRAAGVRAHHLREMVRELHRQLAAAAAHIERPMPSGRKGREMGGQRRWIRGPEPGIVAPASVEPVYPVVWFSRHDAAGSRVDRPPGLRRLRSRGEALVAGGPGCGGSAGRGRGACAFHATLSKLQRRTQLSATCRQKSTW